MPKRREYLQGLRRVMGSLRTRGEDGGLPWKGTDVLGVSLGPARQMEARTWEGHTRVQRQETTSPQAAEDAERPSSEDPRPQGRRATRSFTAAAAAAVARQRQGAVGRPVVQAHVRGVPVLSTHGASLQGIGAVIEVREALVPWPTTLLPLPRRVDVSAPFFLSLAILISFASPPPSAVSFLPSRLCTRRVACTHFSEPPPGALPRITFSLMSPLPEGKRK